jgi:spore coat protein CotH
MKAQRVLIGIMGISLQTGSQLIAADAELWLNPLGPAIQVQSDQEDEWRFQTSTDLVSWTNAPAMGTTFSSSDATNSVPIDPGAQAQLFFRSVKTKGLFDPALLRTVTLTFTNSNWAALLANGRTTGSNVLSLLTLDNGVTVSNVGARYRGNTSYTMGGAKKSVNLDINWIDPDARVMGYRAVNLNNAAGDETIMREPVYFNIMRQYAPCPHGALARLVINSAYWGVYSMVDQINNDLVDQWFPSHDGDRWRAPNTGGGTTGGGGGPVGPGGGGGGFASAASAFSYLGATVSSYSQNYELKSDNSTNAWAHLVHAIDVLNNTSSAELRDKVEDVFAVDRWLWFLAIENILVDDDSYWNKGADYAFYYEPESGRIHPVEHDGNESFTAAMGVDYRLSPVQGATGTNRPLLYKLLPISELRQRYLAHMRTVLEEKFNPSILTPELNQLHQLSVAAIIADPKKSYTLASYTNDLVALKTYVTNRYAFLVNHAELLTRQPRIIAVHDPASEPTPYDMPIITAQVEGNAGEGIDSVWLYWRDKSYGRFSVAQMFDDGAHGDGAANDGLYGGATTNYPAGHKVHYYIEARAANSAKATAFSPARAEEDTYSYRVGLATATNSPVVINELMAVNKKTLADPQGEFDDWIELRNLTDAQVDLTGYFLTDSPDNPRKWRFPDGARIAANGYLLVWADQADAGVSGLHASFKLDADGEEVLLISPDASLNTVVDSVTFGAQTADRSYGRTPADPSTFQVMTPTPGQANVAP